MDVDKAGQTFLDYEVARLLASGAWERTTDSRYTSRAFLVPKPGFTD